MTDPAVLMKWISELEAKIAAKDKQIEELEKELGTGYPLHDDEHLITTDQISAAWERRGRFDTIEDEQEFEAALHDLGIIPCPECGGTKIAGQHTQYPEPPQEEECDCPNNGWVIE